MTANERVERSRIQMNAAYQRDPEKFRQRGREWRQANKDKTKYWDANRRLLRRYGITLEQKEQMMKAQGDECLLCDRPFPSTQKACVDHDHVTGQVRGILCINCNRAMGQLGDSYERLHRVVAYLGFAECRKPFERPVIAFPAAALVLAQKALEWEVEQRNKCA